jgi:taurine--2-oxoglutarate transaminase
MGHFWALELVKNRETKEPFNVKADKFSRKVLTTNKVAADAMNQGLYVLAWYDNLIIAPPLIITEAEVDDAIKILDKSLTIADEETEKTDVPFSRSSEFVIS